MEEREAYLVQVILERRSGQQDSAPSLNRIQSLGGLVHGVAKPMSLSENEQRENNRRKQTNSNLVANHQPKRNIGKRLCMRPALLVAQNQHLRIVALLYHRNIREFAIKLETAVDKCLEVLDLLHGNCASLIANQRRFDTFGSQPLLDFFSPILFQLIELIRRRNNKKRVTRWYLDQ